MNKPNSAPSPPKPIFNFPTQLTKVIEAIYENGVFKPLQKVDLKEGERVRLKVEERGAKRKEFIRNLTPIKLEGRLTIEELKKIRAKKYDFL